jgi:serine/threonine-protein kinase
VRRLGEGAAATVWEAENMVVGRAVALKILHPRFAQSAAERQRFLAEARAAARVAHPNVIDVYDFGQTDEEAPFIVMELLRGETLEQMLRARGTFPYRVACDLMAQVLAALEAAHDRGIVHRDLKPGNIIVRTIRNKLAVKVLDFGIATGVLRDGEAVDEHGLLFGTPEYMAPEQATGLEVDGRTDLYAAGAILYELLSGAPPYTGDFPETVLAKLLTAEPVSISHLVPDLPSELGGVVMSALARDPERRPATARAFLGRIAPFCDRELLASIEPPPPTHAGGTRLSNIPILLARPSASRDAPAQPQPERPRPATMAERSAPPPTAPAPTTLPVGSPSSGSKRTPHDGPRSRRPKR